LISKTTETAESTTGFVISHTLEQSQKSDDVQYTRCVVKVDKLQAIKLTLYKYKS